MPAYRIRKRGLIREHNLRSSSNQKKCFWKGEIKQHESTREKGGYKSSLLEGSRSVGGVTVERCK